MAVVQKVAPKADSPSEGVRSNPQWKNITLFLLTLCVVVLCWLIAFPFLPAVVGSITLAVVTNKPYRWLESKCRNRTMAAAIAVIAVTLSTITPLFFMGEELVKQALAAATLFRDGAPQQKIASVMSQHPALASRLEWAGNQIDLEQASQKGAGYVAGHLAGVLSNSFGAVTQLVLMMFILFFLYRDRELAVSSLRSLLPLDESEADLVLKTGSDTIYATASGRLVVAVVQGTLATLAFWVLGVDGAILWGLTTVLAGMVPLVGAIVVWGSIAIYLTLTGHWIQSLLLIAWGGLVVSTIDNYLYPVLVGSRLQQHTVAVLISVLGGVALFGIPGIILGPLLLSICKVLLEIWSGKTFAKT